MTVEVTNEHRSWLHEVIVTTVVVQLDAVTTDALEGAQADIEDTLEAPFVNESGVTLAGRVVALGSVGRAVSVFALDEVPVDVELKNPVKDEEGILEPEPDPVVDAAAEEEAPVTLDRPEAVEE